MTMETGAEGVRVENATDMAGLLARRGARIVGDVRRDIGESIERLRLTRAIASDYVAFEKLKDALIRSRWRVRVDGIGEPARSLMHRAASVGLIHVEAGYASVTDGAARRFMSGGWLEELMQVAAMEAGADEAICSVRLRWHSGVFQGENEIDVVARHGSRLVFISCKALPSRYDGDRQEIRDRLMDALHETDNLVDHFGVPGDVAVLVVTTDLYDEIRCQPRYEQLHGKAHALDVRLITLDAFDWRHLVRRLQP